jgi:uncharacterized membrane protein
MNSSMGSDGLAKLTKLLHQTRETLQQALKRTSESRHRLKPGTQRAQIHQRCSLRHWQSDDFDVAGES